MCTHTPPCPPATAPDHSAAVVLAHHPEQGWSLLCGGVILFEDFGELLPDGSATPEHRPWFPRAHRPTARPVAA